VRTTLRADLSAWHERDSPLFRSVKLTDGSESSFHDKLMRRKIDGRWEYRALDDKEFADLQQRMQWRQSKTEDPAPPASAEGSNKGHWPSHRWLTRYVLMALSGVPPL
jgi:hypothetical protein